MGLYLGGFTGMYSETALNIALPQLSKAFGVEASLTQWLVIGYMLVIGIVLPFSSILMKWFKARNLALFALGAFLLGALVSGFAPSFPIALAGRAVQGIGTGLILPLMFAMVMEVMPPQRLGAAMGVTALVIMFAPAIGPTLAGFLVGALSWRWIFFSFAIILAAGMIFAARFMINPYRLAHPRLDGLSSLLSVIGFGGVVLGAGMASLYGWLSAPVVISLIIGLAAVVWYSFRQLRAPAPILNLKAFDIPGFRIGALLMMVNFGITLSAMYILPQYYQNGMRLAVALTGIVMLPGGIINAAVSMVAGRLFDAIGARIPTTIGFGLSLLGAVMLLVVSPHTPLAYVIICHIILMVGVPLAMSPSQTHALNSLPHELSTDGSTILNTLQQVLGAVATAVATSLLVAGEKASGHPQGSARAFSVGARWGFAFTVALALIGFVHAFFIRAGKAAPVSTRAHLADETAEPVTESGIRQLMKTEVYTLPATATALDAMRLFTEKKISGAPVVDEQGELVGFVSDGDVLSTLAEQHPQFTSFYAAVIESNGESFDKKLDELLSLPVDRISTKHVITADVNDSMPHICQVMVQRHLKKVPVMDQGRMVGILNRSNILRYAVTRY